MLVVFCMGVGTLNVEPTWERNLVHAMTLLAGPRIKYALQQVHNILIACVGNTSEEKFSSNDLFATHLETVRKSSRLSSPFGQLRRCGMSMSQRACNGVAWLMRCVQNNLQNEGGLAAS